MSVEQENSYQHILMKFLRLILRFLNFVLDAAEENGYAGMLC